MKIGDLIYTKKAWLFGSKVMFERSAVRGKMYAAIAVGVCDANKPIDPSEVVRTMGEIGWTTFDLIAEVLGEEASQKVVAACEAKHAKGVGGIPK